MSAIFEASAALLRERGENAHAFLVKHSSREFVATLEVSRKGGDWQRNLIASIDPASSVWEVEVKITDDEQLAIVRVGDAEVASAEPDDVALAMARAGVARLSAEVGRTAVVTSR